MTDLLPCPFCGGDAQTEQFKSNTGLGHLVYAASCNNENCPIGHKDHGAFERKSDAIKAWNTRAQPKPIDVEKLKRNSCHYFRKTGQYCNDGCFVCEQDIGYNEAIDHLAASGYLGAPLPRIEGLEEAITLENDCLYMSPDEAKAHAIVLNAARAYLALQGGV